ncbi:FHA domain-containing protein [Enterovibrio sp. ZSDZ35]|uniref:FHA domain-containing protein n=1 Tax=Enterovibrio qingdaonensis TaxID=2899818 RepID=A0ABT5QSK7_9GAMM|nr:FHA domain-containing protein [Enterovibrio sp. ZSDZ35]MDD1783970.1 FHA domain-containing protein [Enterovibrio sp. ZSDZ35]
MPLSIRIISSPAGETVSEWNKQFPEDGGEVGRAYGATLQLSDASREISGTHAMIKKSARGYQVIDNSTNGLFINGSPQPLGKGNQTTLNDGDVLNVGQYRLLVSCFVPEQATAVKQAQTAGAENTPFSDDPFASQEPRPSFQEPRPSFQEASRSSAAFNQNVQSNPFGRSQTQSSPPVRESLAPDFDFSSSGINANDPFQDTVPSPDKAAPQSELVDDFSDDPFVDGDSDTYFPSFTAEAEDVFEPVGNKHTSLAEFLTPREHEQQCVEKAMELALARLLEELAPDSLEHMFNDLVRPSFFGRKPKYWDMYKRYFQRQVTNRDWQIKFGAYFQESYRMLKMGEK